MSSEQVIVQQSEKAQESYEKLRSLLAGYFVLSLDEAQTPRLSEEEKLHVVSELAKYNSNEQRRNLCRDVFTTIIQNADALDADTLDSILAIISSRFSRIG